MSKVFDSHIHFNMKVNNPIEDFKEQTKNLDGFILILNNSEEKNLFEDEFLENFEVLYPLSAIAINYELAASQFIERMRNLKIKIGIKLHPRLSNISIDKFKLIAKNLEKLNFDFIIVDCFYYGSSLETHTNLELSIFIAKYFKDHKILLAHGGGHKVLEFMLFTRDLENVYYDFSFTIAYLRNTSIWLDLINFFRFNEEKILFGSDYPEFKISQIRTCYIEVFNEAYNRSTSENVEYLNFRKFLEVE